jgi:hypothetical protein
MQNAAAIAGGSMTRSPAKGRSRGALTVSRRYLYFHPLVWVAIGYAVWMFVPPFFTVAGHKSDVVLIDVVGMCVLAFGYYVGAAVKHTLVPTAKITVAPADANTLVATFALAIYAERLYLFTQVGIYAFLHPYGRQSALIDTLTQVLVFPYIILLMTMLVLTRRKGYAWLLLLEFLLFIVPTLARSYYLNLLLIFVFIRVFYFGLSARAVVKYAVLLSVVLLATSVLGPYMHAVRSLVYVGKIENAESISFETQKNENFLIDRLNVHDQARKIEPVVERAAEIDRIALLGMFSKWLGFSQGYDIHPSMVSNLIGRMIGYNSRTATDVPRNFVLMYYPIGSLAVMIFCFLQGMGFAVIYKTIYLEGSLLFTSLWFPFIFAPAFGGQGAMASTYIFQQLIVVSAFALLFLVFSVNRYLLRLRLYHRTLDRRRTEHLNGDQPTES